MRCKAAGLTESDCCFACNEREDHLHLFKSCSFYGSTRPIGHFHDSTWCTAIFPRSPIFDDWVREQNVLPVLPSQWFLVSTSEPVFIDGSAFANTNGNRFELLCRRFGPTHTNGILYFRVVTKLRKGPKHMLCFIVLPFLEGTSRYTQIARTCSMGFVDWFLATFLHPCWGNWIMLICGK